MQRAVNIVFSQHLCQHHNPDQIATFFVNNNNGFWKTSFSQQKSRPRCGGVQNLRNRILTQRGARFFCAPRAAWEAHFLFFQHLCGERDVFFENRFVRKSVESSKAIFGNLHVFAHTKKKLFWTPSKKESTRRVNVFLNKKNANFIKCTY